MSDVINAFPGYEYKRMKDGKYHNMYRGTDLGRGGYVYAEPGMYGKTALLDIRNMHGESIVRLNKFGKNTKRFIEIREARNAIKAHDFEKARKMLDGKLAPMLKDESKADQLSDALKLICNSSYGIAAASFDNPLRDPRDKNNIIALRGALFMRTLQDEVVKRGFKVIAIRTDSIKIPNATDDIIQFCMEFAKKYGYEFEHECTYERICLVNDSVYIARYDDKGIRNKGGKHANEWTATGAQFQQPYVFKALFSGESLTFEDYCETKSVTSGAIYLDMNENLKSQDDAEEELERRNYNQTHSDKKKLNKKFADLSDEEIIDIVATAHDYCYIGRVGQFTPIKPGYGGGVMLREKDGKYYAVAGTKGYRWLESENVVALKKQGDVDDSYYENLVTEAIKSINEFGSFDRFIDTTRPYENDIPKAKDVSTTDEDDDIPWFDLPPVVPCGDGKYNTCLECPNCKDDICMRGYSLNAYIENGDGN